MLRRLGLRITCREATRLISQSQDARLAGARRLALRLHLRVCTMCSRFEEQMRVLREAMRRYRG